MVILLMMVCPIQVNDVVSCGLGLVDGDTVDDGLPYTSPKPKYNILHHW
jgi:hypothetical protein